MRGYQGRDRRGLLASTEVRVAWLLLWLPAIVLASLPALLSVARTLDFALQAAPVLRSLQTTLALVLAGVAMLLSRATGEARAERLATAAAFLAAAGILPHVAGTSLGMVAVVLAGLCVLSLATVAQVDTRITTRRELAGGSAALALGGAVLVLLAQFLGSGTLNQAVRLVAIGVWAAAAVALVRLWRAGRATPLQALAASLAVGIVSAQLAWALVAVVQEPRWILTATLLMVLGLMSMTVGVAWLLTSSLEQRRSQLHHLRVTGVREQQARREEQRRIDHEARNTLLGLQAALRILREDDGTLQDELLATLDVGLERLQAIVLSDGPTPAAAATPVAEIVQPTVLLARARGGLFLVEGDLDQAVDCRPDHTVQALDNLLMNAVRHGRADEIPAVVTATRVGTSLQLRVSDRGPGVPRHLWERVFEAGVRLDPATEGSGIGLPLARELLRREGGDLWLEPSAEGARFVASLPLAGHGADTGTRPTEEHRDQLV